MSLESEKIVVDCDLSEAGLEQAFEQIMPVGKYVYYVLRIPSQLIGVAFMLKTPHKYGVELDIDKAPDEWELRAGWWDADTKEWRQKRIWSPGA